MNRLKSIGTLLIIFTFLMTACTAAPPAPVASTQAGSDSAEPTTAGDVPAQGDITLNLWGFAGEYEFLPQLIEEFHAEHPNINVEITDIPEGDYVTKIDTALLASEPPDLAYVYEQRWIKNGSFLPLETYLEQENINIEDYNEGVMSGCTFEGKVYCIGTYTGAVLLYYNKDLFDAAGVEYPSSTEPMTIDEYAAMIKRLSKPSDDIQQRVWGGDAGVAYWWVDRETMFSADGRTTEGFINDEATIHFYDVLASLVKDGSVMSSSEAQLMEGTDLLAQGKLATSIIDNAVAIPTLELANVRYGAAPPPVEKKGDLPYTPTWTDSYGVFSKSKHPEEAKMFLAYLIKKGNEKQLELGNLSLNLKLAAEKNYGADNEGRKETLEAIVAGGRDFVDIPSFWDVVGPIDDGFIQMVEEGASAKDVLNPLAPEMQDTLDQSWKTWDSIK